MTRTDDLRHQADAIAAAVSRIIDEIDRFECDEDAFRISLNLSKLLGLLRIHTVQKAGQFYPLLRQSDDHSTCVTATRFALEMELMAQQFERFAERWSSSAVIAVRFDRFRRDALAIFAALRSRMVQEIDELYPLADALPGEDIRSAA